MKLLYGFFLYWFFSGAICLTYVWAKIHDNKNKEETEKILSKIYFDLNVPAEDCRGILYVALIYFGFLFFPFLIVNRTRKFFKGNKDGK